MRVILFWLLQIKSVLYAHGLHRYCAAHLSRSRFLSDKDLFAKRDNNHDYAVWVLLDQFLVAWLQSFLSASILREVIGCRYYWQLCEKIHHHFLLKLGYKFVFLDQNTGTESR